MTDTPVLNASLRDATGSRSARRARRDGLVPAILYGHGQDNVLLAFDGHDLEAALRTPAQLFSLSMDGKREPCLVKEVQYDTVGGGVLHVDLMRVDLSEEVEVEVRLDVVGTPKGVAEGGILEVFHPAITVLCRADSIPEKISLSVAELELGDSIHAGQLELPAGVRLGVDEEYAVAGVVAPRVEEEPEPEAEEGAEEGAEAAAEGEGEEAQPASEEEGAEPETKE